VFTHLPSNILLILTPLAPNLATAIALLLVRSALSQMDVPTRTSYVMAVVTPPERPAAASITAVPKTFAWAAGSMISGYLLTLSSFGWPLLIGGLIKGVYDILLLIKFQKVRPPEEAGAAAGGGWRRRRLILRHRRVFVVIMRARVIVDAMPDRSGNVPMVGPLGTIVLGVPAFMVIVMDVPMLVLRSCRCRGRSP